ncbi:hypothetical protein Hdeb2414_s0006g00200711 [Helianthus debilis subsp. tardiflorus]
MASNNDGHLQIVSGSGPNHEVDLEWDSSQTTTGFVDGNSDLAHSVLEN